MEYESSKCIIQIKVRMNSLSLLENQQFPGLEERDCLAAHHGSAEHVLSGLRQPERGAVCSRAQTQGQTHYV